MSNSARPIPIKLMIVFSFKDKIWFWYPTSVQLKRHSSSIKTRRSSQVIVAKTLGDRFIQLEWKQVNLYSICWCGAVLLDDGKNLCHSYYISASQLVAHIFLLFTLWSCNKKENLREYYSFCITSPSVLYKIMFIHFALKGKRVKERWLNSNLTSIII